LRNVTFLPDKVPAHPIYWKRMHRMEETGV
jgi:hypothetical protein